MLTGSMTPPPTSPSKCIDAPSMEAWVCFFFPSNENHSCTVSRPVAAKRLDGMLEQLRDADDEEY